MDVAQGDAAIEKASPFAAFGSRDFRLYAAARFFATVAVQMQSVAVGFQIYDLTRNPAHLGYVGLAQFLPVMGLSLVAGQIADRFDRRRVLLVCELAYTACALGFFFLARAAHPSLFALYANLVLFGAARAFSGPASTALLPSLVLPAHFVNAVTWQSTLWQLAAIFGPTLGGLVYAWGSAELVYLSVAIVFVLVCVLILALHVRTGGLERRPPSLAIALEGLRYVWAQKLLFASISLDFFAVFLGGAVALLPVFASEVLHTGPKGLGLLRSAPSVGAGLTAAYLAFRPLDRRAGAKMLVCVGLFGAMTIVFGLSKNFAVSLAALSILGAADMVSVVVRSTLEQAATPHAMRGRVSAVNMLFVGASNELGEFESGILASAVGTVPAVVLGGAGTVLVVALWSILFPELRKVDRLSDVRARE